MARCLFLLKRSAMLVFIWSALVTNVFAMVFESQVRTDPFEGQVQQPINISNDDVDSYSQYSISDLEHQKPSLDQKEIQNNSAVEDVFKQGLEQYTQGEFQDAIISWEKALALCQELGNRGMEAVVHYNLGSAHRELGNPHQAIAYLEQAREGFQEIEKRTEEEQVNDDLLRTLNDLSILYASFDQYEQALAYVSQVLNSHQPFHELMRLPIVNQIINLGWLNLLNISAIVIIPFQPLTTINSRIFIVSIATIDHWSVMEVTDFLKYSEVPAGSRESGK